MKLLLQILVQLLNTLSLYWKLRIIRATNTFNYYVWVKVVQLSHKPMRYWLGNWVSYVL